MITRARFYLPAALLLTVVATVSQPVRAQTALAVFNFNDSNIVVDRGAGTLTFGPGFVNAPSFAAGTTVNADSGDPAGQALQVLGNANNGNYFQLNVSTVGFEDIRVSFAAVGDIAGGFNNNEFQYSTDGVNFTTFSSFVPPVAISYSPFNYDLSSVTGLDNNPLAAFRIELNGATNANGTNRYDNLVVRGAALPAAVTPAPPALVSLIIGALAMGGIRLRRRCMPTA